MDCITINEPMYIHTNPYFLPLVKLLFILARRCHRTELRDRCEPNPCNLLRQKCSSKRFTCVPDYCGKCRADVYDFTGKRTRKCLSKRNFLLYFLKFQRFIWLLIWNQSFPMLDSNEFIFIGTCKNRRKDRFCQKLADKGYCNHTHAKFMKKNCKQTCRICGKSFLHL